MHTFTSPPPRCSQSINDCRPVIEVDQIGSEGLLINEGNACNHHFADARPGRAAPRRRRSTALLVAAGVALTSLLSAASITSASIAHAATAATPAATTAA